MNARDRKALKLAFWLAVAFASLMLSARPSLESVALLVGILSLGAPLFRERGGARGGASTDTDRGVDATATRITGANWAAILACGVAIPLLVVSSMRTGDFFVRAVTFGMLSVLGLIGVATVIFLLRVMSK